MSRCQALSLVEREATRQVYQIATSESTAVWMATKLNQTITIVNRFDQDEDNLAFSSGLHL